MDPLKPFTDLVRTLWSTRGGSTGRTESSGKAQALTEGQSAEASATPDDLRTRLRSRLAQSGLADVARAREAFVEVVLTWELGDRVSSDPAFSGVIKAVSDRIAQRPQLSDQLHILLTALARDSRST
jgi:hypothetical protein